MALFSRFRQWLSETLKPRAALPSSPAVASGDEPLAVRAIRHAQRSSAVGENASGFDDERGAHAAVEPPPDRKPWTLEQYMRAQAEHVRRTAENAEYCWKPPIDIPPETPRPRRVRDIPASAEHQQQCSPFMTESYHRTPD